MRSTRPRPRRVSWVTLAALTAATLVVASLTACSPREGVDTPRFDAVPDSPSADAGRTMRVPDYNGPPWTESVPHPGVWQGVEGLPEGCGVRLSATPTKAIPSLRWTPCASGEAGCEEAVAVNGLGYVSFPERAIFHEDARGVHVWVDVATAEAKWSIMWNLTGPTEMVAYSQKTQNCQLTVGSSARGYEMRAQIFLPYQRHMYAVRAPHDAPLRTTVTTLSSALFFLGSFFWLGYGDGFVFTGGGIVPLEAGPSNPPTVKALYSSRVIVAVPGGVLAVNAAIGAPPDVNFYPATGGPPVVVVPVPPGRQVHFLGIDPASGELIRVESGAPNDGAFRIYASPVVTSSQNLVSRFVASTMSHSFETTDLALNAGYMFLNGDRLIRLSDGARWDTGVRESPMFVNREYMWTVHASSDHYWTFRRRPFPKSEPIPAER